MRATTLPALLALALLTPLATGEARADDGKKEAPAPSKSEEASQRFKSGVAFYKDKDFPAALVEFKKAYALLPNYNVLFNLGQTARELKDYAAALTAFEQYLHEGGTKIPAARHKEVASAIDELRRKVGRIKITTSVDGAEILVDDVSVGVSPLADPVVVNVGRRKLSATSSGYTPAQRVVDVASMDETTVSLDLAKIGAATAPAGPKEPTAPSKPEIPLAFWATLSATAAGAVVTGVMGGLALSAHGGLKDALGTYPGDGKAIAAAQSKTRTFAVATDVAGGITIAGAVTSALLFVLMPRGTAKPPPTATVDVTPTGVVVRGVF